MQPSPPPPSKAIILHWLQLFFICRGNASLWVSAARLDLITESQSEMNDDSVPIGEDNKPATLPVRYPYWLNKVI